MKSFISFLTDAYMEEATCTCETCRGVTEGSARGAYTRRGTYAKNRQEFLHVAAKGDDTKGLTGHPHEDGRSHNRTHTTPYNKGPSEYEMDKQRAEKLRTPKKQVRVKLPVNPDSKNDRLSHALRWAAAKHSAEKK